MFVKICGITTAADAVAAVDAGADAIGLNFVPSSRRRIDVEAAASIVAEVGEGVLVVGVFQGHAVDEVLGTVERLGLGAAQLHNASPDDLAAVGAGVDTVIRAVAGDQVDPSSLAGHAADIVMLDGANPGAGATFDWDAVGDLVDTHRVLLAGGLHPGNVAEAIRRVRPWGVDVASGVELEPGRKDPLAMARFVAAAHATWAS